jgi:tetratricopeptide (TPR) repeat protein
MNLFKKIAIYIFIFALFLSVPVHAEVGKKKQYLSQKTYEMLTRAQKLIDENRLAAAEELVLELLAEIEKKPYDRAYALQTLGYVHINQEQYEKSIAVFKQAIALDMLAKEASRNLVINIAQLSMAERKYQEAIKYFELLIGQYNSTEPSVYVSIANAYIQTGQYVRAASRIREAISLSPHPKESWYKMLLGLYYELKEYGNCASVLKTMMQQYGSKKEHWMQLFSVYMRLNRKQEATAVLEMAYKTNLYSRGRDYVQLATMLLDQDAPYKAGAMLYQALKDEVVGKSKKNWELLSQIWLQAREYDRALVVLQRAAALLPNDGCFDLRMAQLYIEKDRWPAAVDALHNALKKDRPRDKGQVFMLLGFNYYELEDVEKAREMLSKAAEFASTRENAMTWLKNIESSL